MKQTKTVAVFCSADNKIPLSYKNLAKELGIKLGENGNINLLTGGANTGLMKEIVESLPNILENFVQHKYSIQQVSEDKLRLSDILYNYTLIVSH